MKMIDQSVVDLVRLSGPMPMRCAGCNGDKFNIFIVLPLCIRICCAKCETPYPNLDQELKVDK